MMGWRLQILFFTLLLLLGGLAARLFQIQILKSLAYSKMARKQFVTHVKAETVRGDILDRNGKVLATSIECQSIYAHPKEVNASQDMLKILGNTLNLDPYLIKNKILSNSDFVWIERKVPPPVAQIVAQQKIKGFGMVTEQKRYYPNGSLASHLIGSVGVDNTGLSGIEQTLDSALRHEQLAFTQLRDGKGRRMNSDFDLKAIPQKNSVTLTLDRALQYYAEKELKAGVQENKAKSGMILIQNPKTGEILAMASYPDFDPNLFSKGDVPDHFNPKWLENPSINLLFEPGSTFKIFTFAAALEEKVILPSHEFECEKGQWKVAGSLIHDHEPEGRITVSKILEKSSNIGTAKIGIKLGKEKLYRYVRAFGFGTRTGLPISGETNGIVREPKDWSNLSLPILSLGQEIGVTAVQLVSAYSAVANGGLLLEPQVIRKIERADDGMKTEAFSPRPVRRVISQETAGLLRRMMRGVVDQGTGLKAQVPGFSVCGKTGTAQKIDPKTGKYLKEKHVASFCGFLPAEDPALVCLVLLDEPQRAYWGGEIAAPIFSRMMSRAVTVLGIPPKEIKSTQGVRLLASKSER